MLKEDSSQHFAMALQSRYELVGRLGRIQHGVEKSIPVRTAEHHAFMVGEDSTSPFIGEISGRKTRNVHRSLDDQLGGRGDPQLETLFLQLAVRRFRVTP
jgi:hypothetical protein